MKIQKDIDKVIQNLKDAGIDSESIITFMPLWQNGNDTEILNILSRHRCSLLENLHAYQERIDCLDYLMYQIRNVE